MLTSQEIGSGKNIIILHGFLGSSDNWRQIAKLFFSDYKVHLIDLRNHGNSFHDPVHNYEVMSNDVIEYIKDKKLNNSILIGHSMGGKVALEIASKIEDLSRLVIVDIAPRDYIGDHQDVLNALKQANLLECNTITECDKELSVYIKELAIRQFLIKNIKRKENKKFEWKINTNYILDNYKNILKKPYLKDYIEIPTLFIKGEKSNYIEDNDIKNIESIFKNVTIKIIKNAGHWVQAEKPKEFSEITRDFIES